MIDLVNQQLDNQSISQLSQQLGTDENTTRQAVPAALTALLGGLSRNASQPQGAEQLAGALNRDHDGSLLDNLAGFFGNPQGSPQGGKGAGILGHIFGNRTPAVESQVGRTTGLNQQQVGRLLMLLAPVVLAALARRKQQQGLDPGGLGSVLKGEREHIERTQPQNRGLLESLLDRDGDGQIADDLAGLAGGFLGGGRR
ncbi:MAG TPA: DUF937 domain-containing protein [Thermoanaerobaculia bacterium]|nr:DUF937 domain-containing protein [Thermoanaerobaculia bacterium]